MKFVHLIAAAAIVLPAAALAVDVNVIGLFPGKAVIVVDRGAPRTFAVGQSVAEGVKLISVDAQGAVLEIDGKRQRIEMGQHFATSESRGERGTVTLAPDSRGHYIVDGQVNGGHMRFMVDTGASLVGISSAEAQRLGIDYRQGARSFTVVADGRRVPIYRIKLDSVSLGDLTLFNVDAAVSEGSMDVALLGMSFLNRTEMRRDGAMLTLTKRY